MQPHAQPAVVMTLDGAQVAGNAAEPDAGALRILVQPVLAGGEPLTLPAGRYRLTAVSWDEQGILLDVTEA